MSAAQSRDFGIGKFPGSRDSGILGSRDCNPYWCQIVFISPFSIMLFLLRLMTLMIFCKDGTVLLASVNSSVLLSSVVCLSSVCLSVCLSVTFVHTNQPIEISSLDDSDDILQRRNCFISERELMFMFAICRRPSFYRLSSVCCLAVCLFVCNVRAHKSAD